MKSTPIPACEIDANIEPLSLRRETAVVEMVEKYRRSDIDSPNRKIVEKWSPKENIKQKSILKVEKELQVKHHLPENREMIVQVCKEIPPNKILQKFMTNHTAKTATKHTTPWYIPLPPQRYKNYYDLNPPGYELL